MGLCDGILLQHDPATFAIHHSGASSPLKREARRGILSTIETLGLLDGPGPASSRLLFCTDTSGCRKIPSPLIQESYALSQYPSSLLPNWDISKRVRQHDCLHTHLAVEHGGEANLLHSLANRVRVLGKDLGEVPWREVDRNRGGHFFGALYSWRCSAGCLGLAGHRDCACGRNQLIPRDGSRVTRHSASSRVNMTEVLRPSSRRVDSMLR